MTPLSPAISDAPSTPGTDNTESNHRPDSVRRWPIGAERVDERVTHFRVWAPRRRTVHVVLEGATHRGIPLASEENGYFSGPVEEDVGTRYRFRLDGGEFLYPDPASRFQPEGPFGPSEVVDLSRFPWSDANWTGVKRQGCVVYEMHIGTFTPEGTWKAALAQLPCLADVGINLLEVMPVAEFAGEFGWGYDGVGLFAPTRLYGRPEEFCEFVDRAHSLGIGVILDVVYNHF